eukprot:3865272-Prymnesium_polylepis.1
MERACSHGADVDVHVNVGAKQKQRGDQRAKQAQEALLGEGCHRTSNSNEGVESLKWQGPPKMAFEISDTVCSVALSHDEARFAAASINRVARVWSSAGDEIATVQPSGQARHVAFFRDLLLVGTLEGKIL